MWPDPDIIFYFHVKQGPITTGMVQLIHGLGNGCWAESILNLMVWSFWLFVALF